MDELVDAINKFIINDAGYDLNQPTTRDAQVDITSNPDTVTDTNNRPDRVTHTSNRILDKTLLSFWNIGEFPVKPLPANPVLLVP